MWDGTAMAENVNRKNCCFCNWEISPKRSSLWSFVDAIRNGMEWNICDYMAKHYADMISSRWIKYHLHSSPVFPLEPMNFQLFTWWLVAPINGLLKYITNSSSLALNNLWTRINKLHENANTPNVQIICLFVFTRIIRERTLRCNSISIEFSKSHHK